MSHRILIGDCREQLRTLPDQSVHCVVTSPPYFGLRDYGHDGQIGQETSPQEFVEAMVAVFREVHRVLRDDGTLWLNLGDSYAGSGKGRNADGTANVDPNSKQATSMGTIIGNLKKATPDGLKAKDLMGIPWEVAFALRNEGWYLRQDIIWQKPNAMPSSVNDRCTTAHEYIFLLTKKPRYYYDAEAIKEPAIYAGDNRGARKDSRRGTEANSMSGSTGATKNKRSVWTINTKPYKGAHFATFPTTLVEPCILAGTSEYGCCADCGTSYVRVVEKTESEDITTIVTVGWERDCSCATTEVVPCTVLDPFAGSGTTLAVAKLHGRNGVGCELNAEYAELANLRINDVVLPAVKLF